TDDFGFTVENRVINNSGSAITLYPYGLVTEHGIPGDLIGRGVVHEGPIGYIGEKLEERDYKKLEDERGDDVITAREGWIGITSKYWLTALIPGDKANEHRFRFVASPAINAQTKTRYQSDVTGPQITVAAGETASSTMNVFSGAKQ